MSGDKYVPSHWKRIKCPFFKSDNFNSVCCEGTLAKSIIRQAFKSKMIKDDWQTKYCMDIKGCETCPIYAVANIKYK